MTDNPLWAVANGYRGDGYVGVIVEAPTEDAARDRAAVELKAMADRDDYGADYWMPDGLIVEPVSLPTIGEFNIYRRTAAGRRTP